MQRYALAALFVPATCFASLPEMAVSGPLDPALVAGMLTLILAQIGVVHMRSRWEEAQAPVHSRHNAPYPSRTARSAR